MLLCTLLLSSVSAFHVYTVKAGSPYQYAEVGLTSDGHWSLNGISHLELYLSGAKLLGNGRKVNVLDNGYLLVNDVHSASSAWGVEQHTLGWSGSFNWYVCPDDNNNLAISLEGSLPECSNPVEVRLYSDE